LPAVSAARTHPKQNSERQVPKNGCRFLNPINKKTVQTAPKQGPYSGTLFSRPAFTRSKFGNTQSDFGSESCPRTAVSLTSNPNTFEQLQEACGLILHSIRFAVQVENSADKPSHAHDISKHASKQSPWVKLISSWCPCFAATATSKHCLVVYTRMAIVASDSLISLFIRPDTSLHGTYQ
jgi:hypothetical protein